MSTEQFCRDKAIFMVNVLGVTQKTLAVVLGMSEGWVSLWLRGELSPGNFSADHGDIFIGFMMRVAQELSEPRPAPEPSEWPPAVIPIQLGEGTTGQQPSLQSARPVAGGNKRPAAAG